jgi:hypothetical protein
VKSCRQDTICHLPSSCSPSFCQSRPRTNGTSECKPLHSERIHLRHLEELFESLREAAAHVQPRCLLLSPRLHEWEVSGMLIRCSSTRSMSAEMAAHV